MTETDRDDSSPRMTEAEFERQLTQLIQTARKNDVDVRGAFVISEPADRTRKDLAAQVEWNVEITEQVPR